MAFFVQHFEQLITYLDQPGVPRTSNHAERANRHYRACTRPRYGWKTRAGQQALLIVLQGFHGSTPASFTHFGTVSPIHRP